MGKAGINLHREKRIAAEGRGPILPQEERKKGGNSEFVFKSPG